MLHDKVRRIEEQIRSSQSMDAASRDTLLRLTGELRDELGKLGDGEDARSVASFAEVATEQASRRQPNPELVRISNQGLLASVEELEASHPALTRVVNQICTALSDIGI